MLMISHYWNSSCGRYGDVRPVGGMGKKAFEEIGVGGCRRAIERGPCKRGHFEREVV